MAGALLFVLRYQSSVATGPDERTRPGAEAQSR